MAQATPNDHATARWQATLECAFESVVSIHFSMTYPFEFDLAFASEATGFVVDVEKGYILTPRHVVGPGPFTGHCVFYNQEEVAVSPVYRDPVHDFGILKFDPKEIKYMPVAALELRPESAKVGLEIRVLGNDAGEKQSILSGVISRLDRNAPNYGRGYNDFNTCYYQANASASGGSSGSPVVSIDGYAVAMQAGGRTDASTDFFLPLDRPLRALRCLQEGRPVTRGDIQCQFLLKPFDECRHLGLTAEHEARMRTAFPKETNMLVAEIVVPDGPSTGKIEGGDIVIKINGQLITQFLRLDDILDSNVGKSVTLELQRGGKDVQVVVKVGDLHGITPDRFVTVAGAVAHSISYQQARLYNTSCKGVYLCRNRGSFWLDDSNNGWILHTVDHQDVPDLESFAEVMKSIPDKSRVVVTYKNIEDPHTLQTRIICVDRHWSPEMRLAKRNDKTGLWDFEDLGEPLPAVQPIPKKASFIQLENPPNPYFDDLVRSFVNIDCTFPIKLDGFPKNRSCGFGLVVDAEEGLIVTSRATTPHDLCDITITIADSMVVEGKVVFSHPWQNYCVIQYKPELVRAPVLSAKLSTEEITQGTSTYLMGYDDSGGIFHAATTVSAVHTIAIPANSQAPRYRAVNISAITIDSNLGDECRGGVLVDSDGTIQALWFPYTGERWRHEDQEYQYGLATPALLPVITQLKAGKIPKLRILPVEFEAIKMADAHLRGVSEDWIEKAIQANSSRRQLFMVTNRFEFEEQLGSSLLEGDILVSLNGKIFTRISELDVMYNQESLDAVIVRDCEEMHLKLPTIEADCVETNRVMIICGAIVQTPHHAVRQQISKLPSEVYVTAMMGGSPACQYSLSTPGFITHIDTTPTPDLESFGAASRNISDDTYFQLRVVTLDNIPSVLTMKKNEYYFPATEWIKDSTEESGWRHLIYERAHRG